MSDDRPLSILHLHWLGDGSSARPTLLRHLHFMRKYAPWNRYWFHDLKDPVTPQLKRARFDVVVFDTSFLCARYLRPRRLFERVVSRYAFLRDREAVKVAFPQDEYDANELLCEWMNHVALDVLFTVLPGHSDVLLPTLRAAVEPSLTGYVDDDEVARTRPPRSLSGRALDVVYRANNLPAYFGRHGRMKAEIAERFAAAVAANARGRRLKLDVSTRPQDVIIGDAWSRFLGSGRFALGCESGSSLLDPRGEIGDRVRAFVAERPTATFDEIEAACFPGLEGQRVFSAISPRIFEVALVGTAQILVPGRYEDALQPGEHYVPLKADASNIDDVIDAMDDPSLGARMAQASWAALIENPRFRYSTLARRVDDVLRRELARKGARSMPFAQLDELMAVDRRIGDAWVHVERARVRGLTSIPRPVIDRGIKAKRWLKERGAWPRW